MDSLSRKFAFYTIKLAPIFQVFLQQGYEIPNYLDKKSNRQFYRTKSVLFNNIEILKKDMKLNTF
ncbi:hypothetical protein CN286_27575 [Bacillus anthracis]|nr:hypothetical protein CN286_27575 [Bacillus anthracis]